MTQAYLKKYTLPEGQSFHFFETKGNSFPVPWHYNLEYELLYVVKSHGKRFVGDSVEDYDVNDMVFLGPRIPHCWCSDTNKNNKNNVHAIVIQFSHDFLGTQFFLTPELHHIKHLLELSHYGLKVLEPTRSQISKIIKEILNKGPSKKLFGLLEILNTLAQSKHLETLTRQNLWNAINPRDLQRIQEVHNFTIQNFNKNISRDQVAKLIHLTPSAFSRFFKTHTGQTFVDFLNQIRLTHAHKLLTTSDKSIASIAFHSGFSNLSNFNRKFKAQKKVTPYQYRQLHKKHLDT